MKKAVYIFEFAIILLLFTGCGKKEDNLDDQLLSKSEDIVATTSTEKTTKSLSVTKIETIDAEINRGVILHGNAICSDGKIITNFTFRATPRVLHESQGNPGHINEEIVTDENGAVSSGSRNVHLSQSDD